MPQDSVIIFVCEHGAAKSIIGATYFNKFARESNLSLHAVARGTHPDSELSQKTITGLQEDGLSPTELIPRKLSLEEINSAQQIISFCELPDEDQLIENIEYWHNIPPVSENYEKARDAILERLKDLLKKM